MKIRPESILWTVDREYSRWYRVGKYTSVLVVAYKVGHNKWEAHIAQPKNVRDSIVTGETRKQATKAALDQVRSRLKRHGAK